MATRAQCDLCRKIVPMIGEDSYVEDRGHLVSDVAAEVGAQVFDSHLDLCERCYDRIREAVRVEIQAIYDEQN